MLAVKEFPLLTQMDLDAGIDGHDIVVVVGVLHHIEGLNL